MITAGVLKAVPLGQPVCQKRSGKLRVAIRFECPGWERRHVLLRASAPDGALEGTEPQRAFVRSDGHVVAVALLPNTGQAGSDRSYPLALWTADDLHLLWSGSAKLGRPMDLYPDLHLLT